MRNINHLLILLIVIMSACKGDPSSQTKYIYKNYSGQDIILDEIYSSTLRDTIKIKNNGIYENIISIEGGGPVHPFACDSINVIYNQIKHKSYNKRDTSNRNILVTKNYEMYRVEEGSYEMYYTFTEHDYLDADSIK